MTKLGWTLIIGALLTLAVTNGCAVQDVSAQPAQGPQQLVVELIKQNNNTYWYRVEFREAGKVHIFLQCIAGQTQTMTRIDEYPETKAEADKAP
jgi:hypothetical protein